MAIATDNTAKGKMEEQLSKSAKTKIDPTSRLTNKIQKKLCKLRKVKNLQTRLILNYKHPTPFYYVYMAQ